MRLLFAIPHYFYPVGGSSPDGRPHGSTGRDASRRRQALMACVTALHQHFGRPQCLIDFAHKTTRPANHRGSYQVHVMICTTQGRHLLDGLGLPAGYCEHRQTNVEPMLLGFACQEALYERIGDFDYYCYLEDDLVVHDPWFFRKLQWFAEQAGGDRLLQPQRYEVGVGKTVQKAYIDGPLPARMLARYRPAGEVNQRLLGQVLGMTVALQAAANPHSGSFFLTAAQLRHWAKQRWFLDRDISFVGPLESAATLGILKTFRIYKPAPATANFLEIEHFGCDFLNLIRSECQTLS